VISASTTVTITNPPPIISLATPSSGTNYNAKVDVLLSASVASNGHTVTKVQFFNGSAFIDERLAAPYSCTWSNVGIGVYAVTARLIYDNGATLDSIPATFSVTLPPPWQLTIVGTGSIPGDAWGSDGNFILSGAGNISGLSDNFQFLYQPLTVNGALTAQISEVSNTGPNAAVGVMIRDNLTAAAKYAMLRFAPDNSIRWQIRTNAGGLTFSQGVGNAQLPNCWANLSCTNGVLTAMISTNNVDWVLVSSGSSQFSANCYIGLAVASGSTNVLNTSGFSNVTVTVP